VATPEARHAVLTRRGTPLHYWVSGPDDGPVVACTHGATLDHDAFAPNIAAMVDAGFRVLTWDLPGHGSSQPRRSAITVHDLAADLLALLDEIDAGPVVLIGQSFGGLVAQRFHLDHPERVRGLIMIGSMDLQEQLPGWQAAVQRLRLPLLRIWPSSHLRRTSARMFARSPHGRRYVERASARQPKRDVIAVTRAALDAATSTTPARTAVPTLLLHGERDVALAIASCRRWASREPACRVGSVPRARHLANLDQPEICDRWIVGFLHHHLGASATR
jgi:3-oxoadipate enol-lactonase